MIQSLIGGKNYNGIEFWLLDNGVLGTSFECTILDFEKAGVQDHISSFAEFLKELGGLTIRWHFRAEHSTFQSLGHRRSDSIYSYGSKQYKLYLHFEKKASWFKALFNSKTHKSKSEGRIINVSYDSNVDDDDPKLVGFLREFLAEISIESLNSVGFNLRNLSLKEIPDFLHDEDLAIAINGTRLESGGSLISTTKLMVPNEFVPTDILDTITSSLPCPFEIRIQMRSPSKSKVSMQMQYNVKRESMGGLFASARRLFSNQEALEKQELEGVKYLAFEWVLVLIRSNADQLRSDTKKAYEILKILGDCAQFAVEQYGVYTSTLLGSQFHSGSKFDFGGILENHRVFPHLLPIALRGSENPASVKSSLAIHRLNHTVDFIDLFAPQYMSYSTVIVGDTGYGKSVFLSQLIRCLYFDEKIKIIVIDVKGSNKRVVKGLGGEVLNINLTTPTGCNPFSVLKSDKGEDTLSLLKEFLAQLCLEEAENALSEKYGLILGIALKKYAENFKNPSLKEFIKYLPEGFDRLPHLKRYTEGLEAKVFEPAVRDQNSRLTYYYLEKLETATNKSLRKALVSSVLIDFYMHLRLKAPEEKIVFFCDEAPFFIQDAFSIFSMLIKNLRALRGSLVLSVQQSENLVVLNNGVLDSSLIGQSALQILFSADGDKKAYQDRFDLTSEDMQNLTSFRKSKGKLSQMLIKDVMGTKTARLYLTDEEFWLSGTDALEIAEIEFLKTRYPELNEREVALILSEAKARGQIQKIKTQTRNLENNFLTHDPEFMEIENFIEAIPQEVSDEPIKI